jgi:hypothetical protein
MTMQDVIDFLLDLLRSEETRAEFERDPDGVLADRGLEGVTAQDVRDARLVLADQGGARPVGDDPPPGGDDPVREIRFTEDNFEAEPQAPPPPAPDFIEQTTTIVAIDDRDTLVVQNTTTSDDDITVIQDSFNDSSTTDVVAIQANRTIVDGEPETGVNPPPAAVVTEPGAEIPASEGNEPDQAAPIDTAPELVDDAPVDDAPIDDIEPDDGVTDSAEPEPAEEGEPDPALDAAVI